MNIIAYLCKLIICSAVLYGYYQLLLRNRSFHYYNRYYLILSVLLSFLLPLVRINLPVATGINSPLVYKALQVVAVTGGETDLPATGITFLKPVFWTTITYGIYGIISMFLGLRLLRAMGAIHAIKRKYPATWLDNKVRFFNTSEKGTPFSFLNAIYWNSTIDENSPQGKLILKHEWFHVKERHTIDLLLLECCCIIGWVNPFFFLIKKELKAIHEFLADEYAAGKGNPYAYMEFLVLKAIDDKSNPVPHYFFQSHLKRRIQMLLHPTGKKYNYSRRLLVLPFVSALFCVMALYAKPVMSSALPDATPTHRITIVVDAGHGGNDAGAQNQGLTEKDLVLSLAKKINELSAAYHVNVVMTRNDDALPEGSNTLKSRVAMAAQVKADLFISLHMNGQAAQEEKGFDIYIPSEKRGNPYKKQAVQFGSILVAALKDLVPVKEQLQQHESEGVFVLDRAVCPAVLLECGYMGNSSDINFISKETNQEALVRRILAAAVAYAGQPKK